MSSRNIETRLEDRIRFLFDQLENMDPSSEEYAAYQEELQKLYEIRNDEIKIHADEAKVCDTLEAEQQRFVKDKIIDVGKTVATIGASAILTSKVLKFEETGVATSKNWMLLPKLNFLK